MIDNNPTTARGPAASPEQAPSPLPPIGRCQCGGPAGGVPTPIRDFVRRYEITNPARFHMPGHKGAGPLGVEALDITEIDGADELYDPHGVIAASEAVASRLFGARTFYSAEGSSLAIRAMLAAALADVPGRTLVLAGRNAHRAFFSAAALIDFDVEWLDPKPGDAYHSCATDAGDVDAALERLGGRCAAVYLTSPDYLGHTVDLSAISAACRRHGARLLVDNAHGAYLKFLRPSRHPIDLGADMCCDSAHKTLPAITGAALLHLAPGLPIDDRQVRQALALFGSSSPSWLILQSLDACNQALEGFPTVLAHFLPRLDALRQALDDHGYALEGDEPMKLTIAARPFGYTGDALAAKLIARGVWPEFHDPDFLTLMPSPMNGEADLQRLESALLAVPRRAPLEAAAPAYLPPERAMSIRAATFAPRETLPVGHCAGRILASPTACCPPCVPIAVCGERIDNAVIERLEYYGIGQCDVVKAR